MQRTTISLILTTLLYMTGCTPGKPAVWQESKDSAHIFDTKALPVITISVSEKKWKKLNRIVRNNRSSETSIKAKFKFEKNGKTYTVGRVGFRVRGSFWSKRAPEPSPGKFRNVHFRIGFDKYSKNKRFFGLRKLLIRGFRADPLYGRQILALDLLNRFGVVAPRASYARLILRIGSRKIRYGIHAMVEPVDRIFLMSRFREDSGNLWKTLTTRRGGEGSLANKLPLPPASAGIEVHRNNPITNYQPTYDLKKTGQNRKKGFHRAKKSFESFISKLNTLQGSAFEKWALASIDVDGLLKLYAIHVLTGNWDDYWNNGKNYYLYRSKSGRWHLIPDDYDYAFGSGFNYGGKHDFSVRNVFRWGKKNRPLMNRVLRIPRFKTIYVQYLRKALAGDSGFFTVAALRKRLRSWHSMIKPFVHSSRVDLMPDEINNFHRIEDSPFMHWGATSVRYRMLSGNEKDSYLLRRIRSAQRQIDAQ